MKKGFMRIIETLLVLMLLFTLMSAIVRQNPSIQQEKNIDILQRYAIDASNMICNSERAISIVMGAAAMTWINNSMNYVMPENLQHSVIVLNSSGSIIKSTGYSLPDNYVDLATSSCSVSRWGLPAREVVVRIWR